MYYYDYCGDRGREWSCSRGKEVVYRDYTHMEADLLDSLKRDEVKTLFRGVHVLRQQAQQVKESTPVRLESQRVEKKN